ncbi:MMS19 nucleotide excision repair protein homolog [Zophobas morio]|jgi:hypothetical protein|uniref:MMS19 nucleotide excision repair protein homolog n=1 Tax=Zophobas morio TaxID=2755281 RepID=UPI00308330CE
MAHVLVNLTRTLVTCNIISEQERLIAYYLQFIKDFNSRDEQRYLLVLFSAVFCNCKEFSLSHFEFLYTTFEVALSDPLGRPPIEELQFLSANKLLACSVCVLLADYSPLRKFVAEALSSIKQVLFSNEEMPSQKEAALRTLSYIAKGLVMSGDTAQSSACDLLISQLSTPKLAKASSEGVAIVLDDLDDVMGMQLGDARKQNFYYNYIGSIKKIYSEALLIEEKQHPLSVALSLLTSLPKPALAKEFLSQILIVTASLQMADYSIQLSALRLLNLVIDCAPDCFAKALDELVTATTVLLSSPSMEIKRRVLVVLYKMAGLPYHELHRFKQGIINVLEALLDDTKRLVRREAAMCRSLWLML